MIEICRRLNLPCYINDEQLEITRDKNKFKQMCKKFGVPIVNEYDPNSLDIKFPVIIKPTDRGGSIGINVAYNEEEYKEFLEYAYSMSPSKCVVLIETCDTTMLTKQKGFETMQKAWTFPSKHEQEYIEQVDENVKSMLMSLGMKCGVANISFFYRNGRFYVFETGFRLGGGHSFDYQRASEGIDYLSCMIKYALGEDYEPDTNISSDRGFAVTYNVYFKSNEGDVVKNVIGENEVKNMPEIVTYVPYLYNAYVVKSDKPAKIAMCTLYAKNLNTIINDIEFINRTLKVETNVETCSIFCELTPCEILEAISK